MLNLSSSGALTLFGNEPADCKVLYYKFLEKHYPELVPRYRSLFGISFQLSKVYQKGYVKNMELKIELSSDFARFCFANIGYFLQRRG